MTALNIHQRAAATVAEMAELGAVFTIADDGERWTWEPRPEIMRNAIRRFWASVKDRNAPGFHAAMLVAIRTLDRGGVRAIR